MAQASKNRKRSLTAAFYPYQLSNCAPPTKRPRLQSMNETTFMCEHRNDTKFIIGCKKTVFDANAQLFCNQSEWFRDLIESNRVKDEPTATVRITDMEPSTFQFIIDFVYLRKPLLTFKTVVNILRCAIKYQLLRLIQHCKQKLATINGNREDWYHIMLSFEQLQQTHASTKASLQPFITHFIQNNSFDDIRSLTLDARFAQLTIPSVVHFIANYTEFDHLDGEATKLLIIHRYLHASASSIDKSTMDERIQKYFIHLLDLNVLTNWAQNRNSRKNNDYDLLIDVIRTIKRQKKKGNQANSRKQHHHNTHNKSIPSTPKPRPHPHHCNPATGGTGVESDNDKKQRVIFTKYGLKDCRKIHATGHGGVWRARCSTFGQSVVIKSALHLYKRDIMNEANILRELNEKQMQNTSDRDIKHGIIRLMDVIEDEFVYMMVLQDGGSDLFEFTRQCHEEIAQGNMLISDWQLTSKLIAYKLAKIVSWLHENGVCHLDISLENILINNVRWMYDKDRKKRVNQQFFLRVIDFGASQKCVEDRKTFECKMRIGKPGCCSPQIFKRCRFRGKAADCWSFGVTLFTLIIGASPWQIPDSDGNTLFQAIVLDRNMDKILSMWKRARYLTVEMKTLLNKIFVIDEDERASIRDIKHDLHITL